MSVPAVEVKGVVADYYMRGEKMRALDGVDLVVYPGEFIAIIGPSGSGKSTLFNIISGTLAPDGGHVSIAPGQQVAYMPQKDLLLPWRTVLGNAVLGADLQGKATREARKRAEELLPLFGLEGFDHALPRQLSGGMRQRVALLRTALLGRKILLLDEPFGALDALTRAEMQTWLLDIWERLDLTVLFTTHDIEEAAFLADRVYVFSPRPAKVALELKVDIPRPRSIKDTAAHGKVKSALWDALHP